MNDNSKKVIVSGIGWLDAQAYGCVRLMERTAYSGKTGVQPPWQNLALFGGPVKNMGRFDAVSRLTCCACALALRDAGLSVEDCRKQDIGLIGTNCDGSMDANRVYFSDYLQAGRKLGRGNLFIYTLPTSPLAESAIHFGLKACNFYAAHSGGGIQDLLNDASLILADGQAASMLAVRADGREAVCFLLCIQESEKKKALQAGEVGRMISREESADGMALKLGTFFERDRTE